MAMVDARNDEKLQILLDRIVPALEPEAVYLFGSRARGDFDEDSDYDLLVIVPDDAPKERRSMSTAFEASRQSRVPADIIPCSRTGFERNKDSVGTLCYEANHFGVRVYGR
ncbi:nucleotidyltransferase domain-containing protein [Azospirillum sp. TSH64]|uniref:nucleotidyltransferase domain-containing protein n=1 Tax=Azospirillum sp. TSH64 TaxID=652740 RepID=UPI000D618159|nr:nucleotidyltransferase domain-containing protein [Azospirillum sp. TSH64]PWC78214.1 DNA polymerase III subunit beta [Azospirillum sp. TSH64]